MPNESLAGLAILLVEDEPLLRKQLTAQLERLEGIVSQRARLGNLLTGKITGLPGVAPHQVHSEDRCGYWFYMFRIKPDAFRCERAEFVKALAAEGVPASGGYIPVPLHRNPVFLKHGFFAGRWPGFRSCWPIRCPR